MLANVAAPAITGINGTLIEVECDVAAGLPGVVIVGLADKAVDEAKDRVRSAIKNSRLQMPAKKLTLNLAPADLPKDGTTYDLAIAVAILCATEQVVPSKALFIGELGLDGSLRPVRGAITSARLAAENEIPEIFVPTENAWEAAMVEGVKVYPAANLRSVYRHLAGEELLKPFKGEAKIKASTPPGTPDFDSIYGQEEAKRAVEIAAAGNHNILLSGSPGSGKTMLARALMGILPRPNPSELIEILQVHSLAGETKSLHGHRPFRHPHHTSSDVALIGGGTIPRPGEISLSHMGVLFLDELPEFPRHVLEVLRQPLEDRQVTIARARHSVTFPANFMLVATQNPCPCGFAGDPLKQCHCTLTHIAKYKLKISGPLLDRIDLTINVPAIKPSEISDHKRESTSTIASRVNRARGLQYIRYKNETFNTNAEMSTEAFGRLCKIEPEAENLAKTAMSNLNLSTRSYFKVLKIAQTIADLSGINTIRPPHVAEAVRYRP
jgi:magnesium chelatase family protein